MEVMNNTAPMDGAMKLQSSSEDATGKEGASQLPPGPESDPQTPPPSEQKQQSSVPPQAAAAGGDADKPAAATPQPKVGKENRHSRPSLVQGVAEWEFPENVDDKAAFVATSLQQGSDATPREPSSPQPKKKRESSPTIKTPRPTRGKRKRYDEKSLEENIIGFQDKRESILFSSPQSRGKGRQVHDDDDEDYFEKTIVPKAFNIEFDKRFVNYAVAPDGSEQKEKFVWTVGNGGQPASLGFSEADMEEVPDLPKRTTKGRSRVGPMYQARIPALGASGDGFETPG